MRAFATSSVKAVRLVQRWVTPGAVALVIVISGMSTVPIDDTRDGAAEDAMRARVFRMHRRVVDRLPSCLTISGRVAINIAVAN